MFEQIEIHQIGEDYVLKKDQTRESTLNKEEHLPEWFAFDEEISQDQSIEYTEEKNELSQKYKPVEFTSLLNNISEVFV